MIASKVTRQTLLDAAGEIGVTLDIDTLNLKGTRHRVKLYPSKPANVWQVDLKRARLCPVCGEKVKIAKVLPNDRLVGTCGDASNTSRWANGKRWKDDRGDSPYQRESVGYMSAGRRVNAVCWHGFRDYFRAVYKREPLAVFKTGVATWKGSEHFEANYRETGYKNIGPPIAPVAMAEACRCPDSGRAY